MIVRQIFIYLWGDIESDHLIITVDMQLENIPQQAAQEDYQPIWKTTSSAVLTSNLVRDKALRSWAGDQPYDSIVAFNKIL